MQRCEHDIISVFTLLNFFLFLRTTSSQEFTEGSWQVPVVSAKAYEIPAEYNSNIKVGIFVLCFSLWSMCLC